MRQIALKSCYRAVDSEKYDKTKRLSRKRALFVAPKERPCKSEIIEKTTKHNILNNYIFFLIIHIFHIQ